MKNEYLLIIAGLIGCLVAENIPSPENWSSAAPASRFAVAAEQELEQPQEMAVVAHLVDRFGPEA